MYSFYIIIYIPFLGLQLFTMWLDAMTIYYSNMFVDFIRQELEIWRKWFVGNFQIVADNSQFGQNMFVSVLN
jgi:hypothetical protein